MTNAISTSSSSIRRERDKHAEHAVVDVLAERRLRHNVDKLWLCLQATVENGGELEGTARCVMEHICELREMTS